MILKYYPSSKLPETSEKIANMTRTFKSEGPDENENGECTIENWIK